MRRFPAALLLVLSLLTPVGLQAQSWERAQLQDLTLEFRLTGAPAGAPVVLIHGGVFADGLEPLGDALTAQRRFRVLQWHRVGYGNSSAATGRADIASQAAQLAQLMRHLELPHAHVVGHSSGALIALQLALDEPGLVRSLVLLEAALPIAGASSPGIAQAVRIYRSGDRGGAIDAFMKAVAGEGWRANALAAPRAHDQAMADAPSFFEHELPAVRAWRFGQGEAQRIRMPVLVVLGGESPRVSAIWLQRHEFLMASLPTAEAWVLPGARHMMAVEDPRTLAQRLASFLE